LRERGTADRVYGLPAPPVACRMGTSGDLELQLHDPSGTVSRDHVELVPVEIDRELAWKVHDLASKNGLCCDGEPLRACVLRPGVEVRLGSLRLIAESTELVSLLSIVRRCLGWAADRQEHVDQALQSLRDWAAQRAELVVVGDGDLQPVVRRWHNLVIGADVPFTWYEPAAGNDAAAAVVKAAGAGTLCVDTKERQKEALAVVERVHGTEYIARPQLVLCTADPTSAATLKGSLERPAVIQVPPLASRAGELADIVQEYAQEIAREQRLPGPELEDVEQLSRWPFRNLAEVEDDALRLVTLRTWGLRPGAARLGIGYGSVRSWVQHRGLKK
jgi:FHA domain-containing protein